MEKDKSFTILAVAIVAVIVLYVMYNFLGKIKSADITLVPAGSQQAINPYTGAPSVIGSPGTNSQNNNSGVITNPGGYMNPVYMQQQAWANFGGAFGNFAGANL